MWTTELTVAFVPLPPEKEHAYLAAIQYFAEVMFSDLHTTSVEMLEIQPADKAEVCGL